MRRLGLIAAGLIAMVTLALALVTSGGARSSTVHTCSATDRQFIQTARTNMTALELWNEQYQGGDATSRDVVGQSRQAAKIMRATRPTDFSLQQTQRLVVGMLTEYTRAMEARKGSQDAGAHMYRAYGLANFAHAVLVRGQKPLARLGCEVESLL